ncbi:hypothetical protein [Sphingopyxis sp.]|uniref:hypothetical protein n=1 Tax=Sphingopyxis sp. TaxID=1908224 RepID=UPI00260B6C80|nr:hypothetical protein [Sphingopyxis sp.]MCW0199550.1 hypothetical protein [Sphingopyxis sp.]
MASKDRMMVTEPQEPRTPGFIWPAVICFGAIFLAGILAGFSKVAAEAGKATLAPWAGPLIAATLGIAGLFFYFRRHADWFRALSRRRRHYWTALGLAAVIGGIVGVWASFDQPANRGAIEMAFTGSLSANFAIGASLFWVIGLLVSMVIYHRSIDDHEERAWLWAGLAGWYAFIFPAPVWWVLHRAGLAPPADAMLLFVLSMVTNGVVYLWLKFR